MQKQSDLIKQTYYIYALIIFVWILAWALKANLDTASVWLAGSAGSFTYWTIAKLCIWTLPALYLIKLSGRTLAGVFNVANWKKWLAWGGGAGFLLALTGFIPKYLSGHALLHSELSFAYLNILVVAPILEELLMRGAIFGNLKQKYSVTTANTITSFMFVGLHITGWYFMGTLFENMKKPVGGAFSILLLSLAFGYVVHRSKSVIGGMLAHSLNNLAS